MPLARIQQTDYLVIPAIEPRGRNRHRNAVSSDENGSQLPDTTRYNGPFDDRMGHDRYTQDDRHVLPKLLISRAIPHAERVVRTD